MKNHLFGHQNERRDACVLFVLVFLLGAGGKQVPDWISYSRESTEAYRSAARMAALSHDKMVATLTMYLPDYDVNG